MNMIGFPNAKINLGLRVISKREDGFHNLSSYFIPIGLHDVLELKTTSGILKKRSISYSGIKFPNQENDLILKAYDLLDNDFNLPPVDIHLHKNIPFGAGLGGGSSNATFMLMMLNDLCNLRLSRDNLLKYTVLLGSDCSFFLFNQFSIVTSIGELIRPIDFSFDNYYVVIIKPPVTCSTQEIFSKYKLDKNSDPYLFFNENENEWQQEFMNDLESVVFTLHPELAQIKDYLYSLDAIYAGMSGSGSSIYGLFKSSPKIENCPFWFWQGKVLSKHSY
jgi:4-diphosphocytidyl-2-C-methyl-D-erythritol kinase